MTRVSMRVVLAAALAAGTSGARARGDLTGMALELHAAAAANDAGAIRKLAAAGAPIEARDKAKRTAPLITTRANVAEAAAALIDAGADVNLADGEGVAPLAHAKSRGYSDMIRMLEAAGAR